MKWVATEAAKGIGGAMAQGVAAGISAEIWRINWAVGQLSGAAINKLKSLLGIASPSKVFYELGEYTGEGLEGDQTITKNSKTLYYSKENDLPVYLFTKDKNRRKLWKRSTY